MKYAVEIYDNSTAAPAWREVCKSKTEGDAFLIAKTLSATTRREYRTAQKHRSGGCLYVHFSPGPTCPLCGDKSIATDLLCDACANQKAIDADDRWNHGGPDL